MSITLRLRTLSKPPRPNATEVTELSKSYEFAHLTRIVDEAITTNREFVVRTATGGTKQIDPSLFQTIAIREEF